jgi:hypothetical protein
MKNIQINSLIKYKLKTPLLIEINNYRACICNLVVYGDSEANTLNNLKQELEKIYDEYYNDCLVPLDKAILIELLNSHIKKTIFCRIKHLFKKMSR